MSKIWDDLKSNMKDWSNAAVEKAEEVEAGEPSDDSDDGDDDDLDLDDDDDDLDRKMDFSGKCNGF